MNKEIDRPRTGRRKAPPPADETAVVKNRNIDLVRRGREFYLHNRASAKTWRINASARAVWQAIDGSRSRQEICDRFLRRFAPSEERVSEILETLDFFAACGAARTSSRGCVHARYLGRLGNRLFIHCFARILAFKLDFDLAINPIDGFSGTELKPYRKPDDPVAGAEVLVGHRIDESTFSDREPRDIFLRGYFQRYHYYKAFKQEIRSDWLRLQKTRLDPGHLIAHIRSGDVWAANRSKPKGAQPTLPVSYYADIIANTHWNKLSLVASHPADPVVQRLATLFQCDIVSQSVMDDFRLISSANKIIMSASTFAWWAAWLSNASEIHFPRVRFWENKNRRVLWIDDESRYLPHWVELPQKWRGDAADVQTMLDR